jgi:hypothetical protein
VGFDAFALAAAGLLAGAFVDLDAFDLAADASLVEGFDVVLAMS